MSGMFYIKATTTNPLNRLLIYINNSITESNLSRSEYIQQLKTGSQATVTRENHSNNSLRNY